MKNWKIIRTIPEWDYSSVDERCLTHDGDIVDLGCLDWDWSNYFIGKKRVIGADPYENEKGGTELFKGIVWNFHGKMKIQNNGVGTTIFTEGEDEFDVITWKMFCDNFNIKKISVLKLNIEGAEYDLLRSFTDEDFENIDQIVVSFHHRINPEWNKDTEECIELLKRKNYTIEKINHNWDWFLAVKNI